MRNATTITTGHDGITPEHRATARRNSSAMPSRLRELGFRGHPIYAPGWYRAYPGLSGVFVVVRRFPSGHPWEATVILPNGGATVARFPGSDIGVVDMAENYAAERHSDIVRGDIVREHGGTAR